MAAFMCRHSFLKVSKSYSVFAHYGNQGVSSTPVMIASLHTSRLSSRSVNHFLNCQRHRSLPKWISASRFNSTSSASAASSSGFINPPSDYIPPAPPIPDPSPATSELLDSLNALGEPTLQSLGLGGYWPPGLFQQALEAIHVNIGLPWWGSIICATLILRLCMFPIMIKSQKVSINMTNHMPTIQRLQLKFTQARQRGNMLEAMQYGGELQDYMKRNNVKPFGQMMMPLCQLPVFVSVFVGLRGMANLPVESMKTGGALWFTDLTITEPVYGLPLLTAATFFLTIEAGADGLNPGAQTHVMKWFLRAMPLIMLPFITNFPAAMLVYWFTSNSFSLCQVLFLKIPQVRTFFNIPERVIHTIQPVEKKGFLEGFKESYSNMKASQQVSERQRIDEMNYRKAAQGPITKTYSYNPKKVPFSATTATKSNKVINKSKS